MTYAGEIITYSEIHMAVLDAVTETPAILLYGFKVCISFHQQDNDLPLASIPESHYDFLWKENILPLSFLHKIQHSLKNYYYYYYLLIFRKHSTKLHLNISLMYLANSEIRIPPPAKKERKNIRRLVLMLTVSL